LNFNLLLIPTLVFALVLFWAGEKLFLHFKNAKSRSILFIAAFVIAIPGFMITLFYLHLYDDAKWFYEFRSFPFTELTASGTGLFAGLLAGAIKNRKWISRPFLIAILCIGLMIPYLKPIAAPLSPDRLSDQWQDGVCLQSTTSSCGAASAATVFKTFGIDLTEKEIAKECFTYSGGTENWYLARAFRKRGLNVNYRITQELPADLQLPAIAGVIENGFGHFITILSHDNGVYTTGDPLIGRSEHKAAALTDRYKFTGFFMEIQKK
jgi:hypothetical protein